MKYALTALIILFSINASADESCRLTRKDAGMYAECTDGREGYIDDRMPTEDIMTIAYRVKHKKGVRLVNVKGHELKPLLNGRLLKNSRYPLPETIAPFINKDDKLKNRKDKLNLQASDILHIEPALMSVSPTIKIYKTTTENGKQKIVHSYGNVEWIDAVPIPAPGKSQLVPHQRKGTGKVRTAQ